MRILVVEKIGETVMQLISFRPGFMEQFWIINFEHCLFLTNKIKPLIIVK